MFKYFFNVIKKLTVSLIVLYSYNLITNRFNLSIPINYFTVFIVALFGPFSIIFIVLFYVLNFR